MELRHISSAEFESVVAEGDVLVDFFATWCGPCKMIAPVLEEIASELVEGQSIVKLDIDKSPELAERFMVTAVPTLVMFRDGKESARLIGVCGEQDILDLFE